jgi:hypothetical protein
MRTVISCLLCRIIIPSFADPDVRVRAKLCLNQRGLTKLHFSLGNAVYLITDFRRVQLCDSISGIGGR